MWPTNSWGDFIVCCRGNTDKPFAIYVSMRIINIDPTPVIFFHSILQYVINEGNCSGSHLSEGCGPVSTLPLELQYTYATHKVSLNVSVHQKVH